MRTLLQGYAEKIGKKYNYRGILLLRNPIEAAITYRHYQQGGQTGIASPAAFHGPLWDSFLGDAAKTWADHAIRWIQGIRNGTVIFYEMLKRDPEKELGRLLRAINFTNVSLERMRCAISHSNRTDRKRIIKPW